MFEINLKHLSKLKISKTDKQGELHLEDLSSVVSDGTFSRETFFVGHFRNKTFSGKALESFIPEMTSKKTFTYT